MVDLTALAVVCQTSCQEASNKRVSTWRALITTPRSFVAGEGRFLRSTLSWHPNAWRMKKSKGIRDQLHPPSPTDQDRSTGVGDEILVMNDAGLNRPGAARDVFNAQKTRFVAQFMGGH